MGRILHHAIVVTSQDRDKIIESLGAAVGCGNLVSDIVRGANNGYFSFFVAPDGSNEGWPESEKGNQARSRFIKWLDGQRYEDGSSPLTWAELVVGGDEVRSYIVTRGDEDELRRRLEAAEAAIARVCEEIARMDRFTITAEAYDDPRVVSAAGVMRECAKKMHAALDGHPRESAGARERRARLEHLVGGSLDAPEERTVETISLSPEFYESLDKDNE